MTDKVRISTISYTNTKPFVYGMKAFPELDELAEIIFDTPADAASKLLLDQSDLGIVPVAILPELPVSHIITDYCIGADGPVNSVFVFSHLPAALVKVIRLDPQSRTSNNLARVLCSQYWMNGARFIAADSTEAADAQVLIGDRTFLNRERFEFAFDLSAEWKSFTGLPFVFAVWASNKKLDPYFINVFNQAMKYGVDHISELLTGLDPIPGFDLDDYLRNKLSFTFTDDKKEGLELYLNYIQELNLSPRLNRI